MDQKALTDHIADIGLRLNASPDPAEQERLDLLLTAYMSLQARLEGRRGGLARGSGRRRASAEAMGLQTALTHCRRVTISISQLFKVQDFLLADRDDLRAVHLRDTVNDVGKFRRALNANRGIEIQDLGTLEPVAQIDRPDPDSFWSSAIPDLRDPAFKTDPPLAMIPFELSPFPNVESVKLAHELSVEDLVKDTLGPATQVVKVAPVRSSLRIYPTGVGVVRLSTDLEFSGPVLVELIANVAHAIEDTVFVDTAGQARKTESFLAELVNLVATRFFKDTGDFDRRWRPPDTIIHLRQGAFLPEDHTRELAYAMSLSPGNAESLVTLRARIEQKLRSAQWVQQGVLALRGRRVLLLVRSIDPRHKRGPATTLKYLMETHELVSAALHTYRVFADDLQRLRENDWPNDDWLPGTENFTRLELLVETIRRATRAVRGVPHHLTRTGRGILTSVAREIWDAEAQDVLPRLTDELLHVGQWTNESGLGGESEMVKLASTLASIATAGQPFAVRAAAPGSTNNEAEEALENEILDGHKRIEELIAAEQPDFEELDAEILRVEDARRRLFAPLD